MVSHSLPSPPAEDNNNNNNNNNNNKSSTSTMLSRKGTGSSTKSVKATHRTSKRAGSNAAAVHHHEQVTHSGMDGRHKRVWKACERCRMKKTKCDGEFPCKRCKDDGLVCTAGVRKKMEYKQLPRGYAEVLENTQFALIATVHKLYAMVRNHQAWDLGEPELNDRGQPVIHNIAQKLGCIRPNSDIDLPVHSVFPEDEAGMAELARQLEEQQHQHQHQQQQQQQQHNHDADAHPKEAKETGSPMYNRTDRASSSELDHSDMELDYRRAAFGGHNNPMTMSPQSFTGSADLEFSGRSAPPDLDATTTLFASQSPPLSTFSDWTLKQTPGDMTMQFLQQASMLQGIGMMGQGLTEAGFGAIKPHVLSVSNSGVMMSMTDPMIFSGYDEESIR
ncbi:c6 transcription factor, partial [Trichoderma cornu-damae]